MAQKKVIRSFVWGAVAGAAAALLLAPKSGKELRKDLAATAKQVGKKSAEYGRQAGEAARTIASKAATLASDAKQAAGRLVTELRTRKDGGESREKERAEQNAAAQ